VNRRSLLGLAAGAVVGSAGCVENDDATEPDSSSASTSAESVDSVEFQLVDPERDAEAAPEVDVDENTVTARGTVRYASSTCGTVELAHAEYEASQDRLDLLVVAGDDPDAGSECTEDIDAAGYRLEATVGGRLRRVAATEHHAFGNAYSTTTDVTE
jgi:predicted dinucleotide-binding enzyme